MKKIILAFTLALILWSPNLDANVNAQYGRNNYGQTMIRIVNNLPRPVSCFYRDQYQYYTFVVGPGYTSNWFLIQGQHQWQCR